ncbi:MAG: hypothetical protein ACI85Z_000271 [Rheinheimera aquimaris]
MQRSLCLFLTSRIQFCDAAISVRDAPEMKP